jgi:metallophosphoesterase superfamily enzyme
VAVQRGAYLHAVHSHFPETIAFWGAAIDYAKPDLVVFNGDNVSDDACASRDKVQEAIARNLGPVVERKLSFAFTFGNHDQNYRPGGMDGRAEMMAMYLIYPGCLAFDEMPGRPGQSISTCRFTTVTAEKSCRTYGSSIPAPIG